MVLSMNNCTKEIFLIKISPIITELYFQRSCLDQSNHFFTCILLLLRVSPGNLSHTSSTCPLQVYDIDHTHSLASVQQSGPSKQRVLLRTESCLKCQKWSLNKAKGVFQARLCKKTEQWPTQLALTRAFLHARKQNNGPPSIEQDFSTASCNSNCALLPQGDTHPSSPRPTLSASTKPIFKLDCANS